MGVVIRRENKDELALASGRADSGSPGVRLSKEAICSGWYQRHFGGRGGPTAFVVLQALILHGRPAIEEDLRRRDVGSALRASDLGRWFTWVSDCGIADALGQDRKTVAQAIRRLAEEQLIECRPLHTQGRGADGRFGSGRVIVLAPEVLRYLHVVPEEEDGRRGELTDTAINRRGVSTDTDAPYREDLVDTVSSHREESPNTVSDRREELLDTADPLCGDLPVTVSSGRTESLDTATAHRGELLGTATLLSGDLPVTVSNCREELTDTADPHRGDLDPTAEPVKPAEAPHREVLPPTAGLQEPQKSLHREELAGTVGLHRGELLPTKDVVVDDVVVEVVEGDDRHPGRDQDRQMEPDARPARRGHPPPSSTSHVADDPATGAGARPVSSPDQDLALAELDSALAETYRRVVGRELDAGAVYRLQRMLARCGPTPQRQGETAALWVQTALEMAAGVARNPLAYAERVLTNWLEAGERRTHGEPGQATSRPDRSQAWSGRAAEARHASPGRKPVIEFDS
jgi:hypothetical protein